MRNPEQNSKTQWKIFGTTTGIKHINIKKLADSGKDIRVVVGAQYVTTGKLMTNFVFDLSPNVIGRYSDGYCFSQNNYAALAIMVNAEYNLYVLQGWWSMRESANVTIPINDETVKMEVHYR